MKFTYNSFMIFMTILFVIFVSAAELDICVPSFPQIGNEFELSPFKIETLLSGNLLFHCIAALLVGNLGDKYGKQLVINIGFFIFILGNIICFFSPSYYLLLVGRILQGIGAAASLVLAPLMIFDIYKKENHQKMVSMINGFATLSICFAPTIGSYLTLLYGWRSNFFLLIVLGVLAFGMFNTFIPHKNNKNSELGLSLKEYLVVFKSPTTTWPIACLVFCTAGYYTFVGMGSIIYIDSFGVSLKDFGIYQGLLTFTFGTVSIFSGSIIKKIGKKIALRLSLILIFIFLVFCLFLIVFNVKNPNYITASIVILSVGVVVPCNVIYVFSLDSIPGASGKISGVITTGKWIFTIVGVQLASYFYTEDFRSTGILILGFEFLVFVSILILLKRDQKFRQEVYEDLLIK